MKIAGKVAVVTGGASGLGEATVRRLVADGAQVVFFDVDEVKSAKLVAELGGKAEFRKVDITSPAANKEAVDYIAAKYGHIDILCNIAGRGKAVSIVGKEGPSALEDFTSIIDLNLNAGFDLMRLCAWAMTKNTPEDEDGETGVIINTSSIASFHGQNGQQAYSASKGAINSICLPAARGFAKRGIRVAAIAPGLFLTPIYDKVPQVLEELKKTTIFPKRLGKPEEYADMVAFIIGNKMVNGECYRLDGAVRF